MHKKISAALAGTGIVLATSGCGLLFGGGGGGGAAGGPLSDLNPVDLVAEAVNNTEAVDSYTATMEMSGSMSGVSLDMTSDIEYTATPEPTVKMESTTQGTTSTILMRGSEMVMQSDMPGAPPGGPEWLRMDLGQMGEQGGGAGAQDPLAEVEKLLAAQDVQEEGSADVNGVETTRYSGTYSTEEALQELDPEAQEAARQVYDQSGVSEVSFEVFVDGDGMPRRVTTDAGGTVTSSIDFTSFNEPVTVEWPSEDQIGDFDSMMDDMMGDVPSY
ncbi:hypothetical protein O4J56_10350 [Nocardiopsis sp. RSe5-2]|uniref:LppX_LprAFG lipoprotein n=1 Tax=Nocardiopsis endophytica TaxID=3018445 RepID=A0ABT4U269_9ACTN|nr:hypothetical protein [Nocardiopsis endophytica]MDA2811036.1 hypothetical protein [Nocardiopsis endophytica]